MGGWRAMEKRYARGRNKKMVFNIYDKLSITPDFTYGERLAHNQ